MHHYVDPTVSRSPEPSTFFKLADSFFHHQIEWVSDNKISLQKTAIISSFVIGLLIAAAAFSLINYPSLATYIPYIYISNQVIPYLLGASAGFVTLSLALLALQAHATRQIRYPVEIQPTVLGWLSEETTDTKNTGSPSAGGNFIIYRNAENRECVVGFGTTIKETRYTPENPYHRDLSKPEDATLWKKERSLFLNDYSSSYYKSKTIEKATSEAQKEALLAQAERDSILPFFERSDFTLSIPRPEGGSIPLDALTLNSFGAKELEPSNSPVPQEAFSKFEILAPRYKIKVRGVEIYTSDVFEMSCQQMHLYSSDYGRPIYVALLYLPNLYGKSFSTYVAASSTDEKSNWYISPHPFDPESSINNGFEANAIILGSMINSLVLKTSNNEKKVSSLELEISLFLDSILGKTKIKAHKLKFYQHTNYYKSKVKPINPLSLPKNPSLPDFSKVTHFTSTKNDIREIYRVISRDNKLEYVYYTLNHQALPTQTFPDILKTLKLAASKERPANRTPQPTHFFLAGIYPLSAGKGVIKNLSYELTPESALNKLYPIRRPAPSEEEPEDRQNIPLPKIPEPIEAFYNFLASKQLPT